MVKTMVRMALRLVVLGGAAGSRVDDGTELGGRVPQLAGTAMPCPCSLTVVRNVACSVPCAAAARPTQHR